MTLAKTIEETSRWPAEDQLSLLGNLWDRLAEGGHAPELDAAQKAEFDRRLDELDANPSDVLTWENIVASVKNRK